MNDRHAHHEKLVGVAADNRQKLDAFQQRDRLVLRLRQHAAVEINPTEFAVDVILRRQFRQLSIVRPVKSRKYPKYYPTCR